MFKLIRKYIIFYFIYNRGITRENIGEYPDALDYFYLALSLRPNSVKTYKSIARVCRKSKTCLNGIDFVNKASWRFPDKAELYAIKADLYRKIKDYVNAIKEYDLAIKYEGENWEYYLQRAKIKALNNDIQGALNDCNGAINNNPKNDKLYSLRAFYYFERKNFVNAALDYENAIKINSKNGHYYFMLACMQKLSGQDSLAVENYKKANEYFENWKQNQND